MSLRNFRFFDAHLRIIHDYFPLTPDHGYLPPSFTCESYINQIEAYYLVGGTVVSGSFQAFDQTYLIDAIKKLGSSFVGVIQISVSVSDEEILKLNCAGIRAVRFNLNQEIKYLDSLARRVHELVGWHVGLYVDSREFILY